jgi:hypothetical protein
MNPSRKLAPDSEDHAADFSVENTYKKIISVKYKSDVYALF